MRPARPTRRWFFRTALLTSAVVAAQLFVGASCTSTSSRGGVGGADGGDGPTPAADGPDATCPLPPDNAGRCSGNDPTFVFFPPVSCDPSLLDAGSDGAAIADASLDASDAAGDGGPPPNPCAGVTPSDIFFTPTACTAFVGADSQGLVVYGSPRLPVITEPQDGAALTPDNWSIFAWNAPTARLSPLDHVLEWIEPSAHALNPLNGDAYVLEFSQGCTEVMRVMVAATFWNPDPVSWNRLTALTGPVLVRVVYVKFAGDALAPGTEPLASAPITITMMK